jgi:hypothetical protein
MPLTGESDTNGTDTRYDLNALFKKQFGFMTVNVQGLSRVSTPTTRIDFQGMFVLKGLYFGKGVYQNYALQIKNIVLEGRRRLGEIPTIIGECGVPMDMKWVLSEPD